MPIQTRTQPYRGLTLALLAMVLLGLATPTMLRAEPTGPLEIAARIDGMHLHWNLPSGSFSKLSSQFLIPDVEIGGLRLPAKLVALRFADGVPAAPRIDRLESVPWAGAIRSVDAPIPQTSTGERQPALAERRAPALPETPLVVLREGRMRGARVTVLALSPIFAIGGRPHIAIQLEATLPGATPLAES